MLGVRGENLVSPFVIKSPNFDPLLTPPTSGWVVVSKHNRNAKYLPVHICFYFLPLWSLLFHNVSICSSHPCGWLNRKGIPSVIRATSTGQEEVWGWDSVRNRRDCFCGCTEDDCLAEIDVWTEPDQEHTRARVWGLKKKITTLLVLAVPVDQPVKLVKVKLEEERLKIVGMMELNLQKVNPKRMDEDSGQHQIQVVGGYSRKNYIHTTA